MYEDPDETRDIKSLNSDESFLPVEVAFPFPVEAASLPPFQGINHTLPETGMASLRQLPCKTMPFFSDLPPPPPPPHTSLLLEL